MHIADLEADGTFYEVSFDLDTDTFAYKELKPAFCNWSMQRQFSSYNDFVHFLRSHAPDELTDAVIEWIEEDTDP